MKFLIFSLAIASICALPLPTDKIGQNQSINRHSLLISENREYYAQFQGDSNFVVYSTRGGVAKWATKTQGKCVKRLYMQDDGNLVFIDCNHHSIWSSGTNGYPGAYLKLTNNGSLIIYTSDHEQIRKL